MPTILLLYTYYPAPVYLLSWSCIHTIQLLYTCYPAPVYPLSCSSILTILLSIPTILLLYAYYPAPTYYPAPVYLISCSSIPAILLLYTFYPTPVYLLSCSFIPTIMLSCIPTILLLYHKYYPALAYTYYSTSVYLLSCSWSESESSPFSTISKMYSSCWRTSNSERWIQGRVRSQQQQYQRTIKCNRSMEHRCSHAVMS